MACCGKDPYPVQNSLDTMLAMPDSTLCCMGKMTYTLTKAALDLVMPCSTPAWTALPLAEQAQVITHLKRILSGETIGLTLFDRLFSTVVKTMITGA